jgi:RNase P subunit RPR2
MTLVKPENCQDEAEFVYYCDNCGTSSRFSDYWWPGCCHWEEINYTLCNDCLRILEQQHITGIRSQESVTTQLRNLI